MPTDQDHDLASRPRAPEGTVEVGGGGNGTTVKGGRIGFAAGFVGILCCVGPTILAAFGVLGAAAASDLAYDLYGDHAWWFRGAGLAVGAGLVWVSLRRRDACDIRGLRSARRQLLKAAVVAVVTYVALYALTTWLGNVYA